MQSWLSKFFFGVTWVGVLAGVLVLPLCGVVFDFDENLDTDLKIGVVGGVASQRPLRSWCMGQNSSLDEHDDERDRCRGGVAGSGMVDVLKS